MRLKLILLWFILYGVLGVNGIVESIFNKIMPWNTKKHPEKDGDNYGVDVTTPIHHYLDENSQYGKIYNDFMEGCYAKYSRRECDMTEEQRIAMNLNQPRMQYNYTETGFLKMKVPESVWSIIKEFYDRNKHLKSIENWPRGNTYVNHWNNPTEFVSVENTALVGGGDNLKLKIWNGIKPVLEDWVDQELTPTSLYGIRIYRGGATLSTHVDRLPLVTSCIINVDQELEQPWPIEVYSHDGRAHNVTMAPGDMVLYESHTVLHGRPFPMKGDMYANIFVHFKPVHHDEILRAHGSNVGQYRRNIRKSSDNMLNNGEGEGGVLKVPLELDPLAKFGGPKLHDIDADHDLIASHRRKRLTKANAEAARKALGSGHSIQPSEHDFKQYEPPRLKKEVSDILKRKDLQDLASMDGGEDGGTRGILHQVAQIGDLQTLMKLLKDKSTSDLEMLVNSKDSNGWQPIHEAVRGGHLQVVKYLVEVCGADISATTEKGGTALWWARQTLNSEHPVIAFLTSIGAPNVSVGEDSTGKV